MLHKQFYYEAVPVLGSNTSLDTPLGQYSSVSSIV